MTKASQVNFFKLCAGLFIFNGILYLLLRDFFQIPTDTVKSYIPLAVNLLKGNGYVIEGHFRTYPLPGFPLFLSGVFWISKNWSSANKLYPCLIILSQSISAGFVYLISEKLFQNKRAAALSSLLLTVYPFYLILTATKYAWNAMPLFMLFFYASLYLFTEGIEKQQKITMLFSGFILGSGGIIWAGVLYLWLPLTCMALIFNLSIKKTFLFILGFFLPFFVWGLVIYMNTNQMLLGGNPMTGVLCGIRHTEVSQLREYEVAIRALHLEEAGKLKNWGDILSFFKAQLLNNPQDTVRFLFFKLWRPWYATDSEKYEMVNVVIQIPYIALAVHGMFCAFKAKPKQTILLLLIICYFWAIAFVELSILRYMIPAMGLMIIFAAISLNSIASKFLECRRLKHGDLND